MKFNQSAIPHTAHDRYVAVIDILGMKSWLEFCDPESIANAMHESLIHAEKISTVRRGPISCGPLLGATQFSDTILVWSIDTSWASLHLICSAVKMIVGGALTAGIPLRGSISRGKVVCNVKTLTFVGNAISDAFVWSEKCRPYRSAGVDITPRAIEQIQSEIGALPQWLFGLGMKPETFTCGEYHDQNFMRFSGCLMINHWGHAFFLNSNIENLFKIRNLPENKEVQEKLTQMNSFYFAHTKAAKSTQENLFEDIRNGIDCEAPHFDGDAYMADMVKLEKIRQLRNES